MSDPTWFNKDEYLTSKLLQLRASGDNSYVNVAAVEKAITDAGMTPFSHFEAFGLTELTSPNQYFNAREYLEAKTKQMNELPDSTEDWTPETVLKAIEDAGMSIWSHFQTFGWQEDVNPSNTFDVSAYFETKLAQLQVAEPGGEWTLEKVQEAFAAAGTDPISHFSDFGDSESLETAPVPEADRVPTDTTGVTTHTLTTGVDAIQGTPIDDTIQGILGTAEGATLNTLDTVDGGLGTDTLNLVVRANTGIPSNANVTNVEIVNLISEDGVTLAGGVDARAFGAAAQQIWQVSAAANATNIGANQTVGFRDITTADQGLSLNFSGATANIAVANEGGLQFNIVDQLTEGADVLLNTLNVSGSATGLLEFGATLPTTLATINLAIASNTGISVQSADALSNVVTIDASASTGALTVGFAAVPDAALESLTLGSGGDQVSIATANLTAEEVSVQLGAGNDNISILLDSAAGTEDTAVALSVAGGAGSDTFHIAGGNISAADITAKAITNTLTITDFAAGDVLNLQYFEGFSAQAVVNNVISGLADDATLFDAVEAVANTLVAGGVNITNSAQFAFDGNTYVYTDDSTTAGFSAGDTLVGLTGVVTLTNDNVVSIPLG